MIKPTLKTGCDQAYLEDRLRLSLPGRPVAIKPTWKTGCDQAYLSTIAPKLTEESSHQSNKSVFSKQNNSVEIT